MLARFYSDANCTDCSIYVGSLSNIITTNTDFASSFPNISIVEAFDPSIDDFGSKLFLRGLQYGTGSNFDVYCIGAVSYCVLEGLQSMAFVNTILFCEIDEINEVIGAAYPGNSDLGGIPSGYENADFPHDTDWSI